MTKINYYGDKDNFIHIKFNDMRKRFNFTDDFMERYPQFTDSYRAYFFNEDTIWETPLEIVDYVYKNKIPVKFYFNYTDKPANSQKEVRDYFKNYNN